ncbi:MAG: hypothetical protein WDN44_07490 [Sphingomonas sp.]
MAGMDALLIDHAEHVANPAPRHDAVYALEYKPEGVSGLTLFELAPLVRALRALLLGTRPLRASDLALAGEASKAEDENAGAAPRQGAGGARDAGGDPAAARRAPRGARLGDHQRARRPPPPPTPRATASTNGSSITPPPRARSSPSASARRAESPPGVEGAPPALRRDAVGARRGRRALGRQGRAI